MKAALIHSFGGPEVLELEEVSVPSPLDDEVLVHVRAASVNPVDYKTRAGKYPPVRQDQLPLVLGRDAAGTVERCGARVAGFKPDDAVFAMLDRCHGGYAEYVIVKVEDLVAKPENTDYLTAAAVPLAALTAWQGLFDYGRLQAGQHVLIHGGAGGVGHMAIQLAKARGALVSTTVSRKDVAFARELGADHIIDHERQRFEDHIRNVDLVYDLLGGDIQERSWTVLKRGGSLISTLKQPSEEKAKVLGARAEHYMAQPSGPELTAIARLIEDGKLRPHVDRVYPFAKVQEAHRALESGHPRGKIVLQMAA